MQEVTGHTSPPAWDLWKPFTYCSIEENSFRDLTVLIFERWYSFFHIADQDTARYSLCSARENNCVSWAEPLGSFVYTVYSIFVFRWLFIAIEYQTNWQGTSDDLAEGNTSLRLVFLVPFLQMTAPQLLYSTCEDGSGNSSISN